MDSTVRINCRARKHSYENFHRESGRSRKYPLLPPNVHFSVLALYLLLPGLDCLLPEEGDNRAKLMSLIPCLQCGVIVLSILLMDDDRRMVVEKQEVILIFNKNKIKSKSER